MSKLYRADRPTVKAVAGSVDAATQDLNATVLAQWEALAGQQKALAWQGRVLWPGGLAIGQWVIKIWELEQKLVAEKECIDAQGARLKAIIEEKLKG